MIVLHRQKLGAGQVTVAHTTKADGDLSPSQVPRDELNARRAGLVEHPWKSASQVHSDRVLVDEDLAGWLGDALVSRDAKRVLAVHSGDCVPLALLHSSGGFGVVHAGWQGLERGVVEAAARALRDADGTLSAVVGPHIRADRYEFGQADLARLQRRFGDTVASVTAQGSPALDLTAALHSEFDRLGIERVAASPDCTAAMADQYWSYRARGEAGRIALVAWIDD